MHQSLFSSQLSSLAYAKLTKKSNKLRSILTGVLVSVKNKLLLRENVLFLQWRRGLSCSHLNRLLELDLNAIFHSCLWICWFYEHIISCQKRQQRISTGRSLVPWPDLSTCTFFPGQVRAGYLFLKSALPWCPSLIVTYHWKVRISSVTTLHMVSEKISLVCAHSFCMCSVFLCNGSLLSAVSVALSTNAESGFLFWDHWSFVTHMLYRNHFFSLTVPPALIIPFDELDWW